MLKFLRKLFGRRAVKLTAYDHMLRPGDRVRFGVDGTGSPLPTGIEPNTEYQVTGVVGYALWLRPRRRWWLLWLAFVALATACATEPEPDTSVPPDWAGETCDQRVASCHVDDPDFIGACVPRVEAGDWVFRCWPECRPVLPDQCPDGLTPFIYGGAPGRAGYCACVDLDYPPAPSCASLGCPDVAFCNSAGDCTCGGESCEL